MNNSIQSIAIDKLLPHPDNPNRMSRANFDKLVRNIERSGRYEPLVVRPCPQDINRRERKERGEEIEENNSANSACSAVKNNGFYQIINGYHRWQALKQLGYKTADVVIWDIDDHQTDILLATLNRLGGRDSIEKKLALLQRLNKKLTARELAKILPATSKQIEHLVNFKLPSAPAASVSHFANPLVFFVTDSQQQIIEQALSVAKVDANEKTRAAKRAAALTTIALGWLESKQRTNYEG